jgi:multiple sugar transport system substrate-binding protein
MKQFVKIILIGALCLGFASQGLAKKKFDGIKLKMLACGDTAVTRLVKILDEFEAETGAEVTIDMYPYPGLIDKIVVETSSNSPTYQLFWVDSPWIGQLGEANALLDLTPLAMRDFDEIKLDDIVEIQLQENAWQGKLYAMPASGMTWMVQYRKDLFDNATEKKNFKNKYGYNLAAPKTWNQYRDIAEFFTRKPGEKLAGKVLSQPFYGTAQAYSRVQGAITHDYFAIMRGFGGDFWSQETGFSIMNQEPHIKSAEFMKSLMPFNPPDALALMWDLRTGYFERGETAISGYWSVRSVRLENPEEAKVYSIGDTGYAPAPNYQGTKNATYTGSLSFAINSRANRKEKEAAWEFIKWGTGEKITRRLANAGISQFRKSILGDAKLQKKFPYYKTLLEQQKPGGATRRIFHPFYADVEEVFGVELNKFMMGDQTAKEALDKATQAINSRLNMFPKAMRVRWVKDIKAEVLDY